MYKKTMNPFTAFLSKYLMFSSLVNFADDPGGMIGDAGASGNMGAGSDGGMGGSADDKGSDAGEKGEDNKEGDAGKETDAGKSSKEGDAAAKNKSSDDEYGKRISGIDKKINDLFTMLKGSNSGNDGKSSKGNELLDLEHVDLVTLLSEDPEGFIGKLTQAVEGKVTEKVLRETASAAMNEKIENTINSYADSDPTFEKMWDDGSIKTYMEKNPGHNAISAHMAMTMEAKIAEAEKRGAEKAVKNFRTKSSNQVLNGGPGISPDQRDAALKDTAKFGGRAAVLAARAGIK